MRIRTILLLPILCLGLLCLGGCTDADLARSARAVETAETWHQRAIRAQEIAEAALAQAESLAERLDSQQAAELIARAEAALAVTRQGVETSGAAVAAAKDAQAAAQQAHASGGGTWSVLVAAITGALGTVGVLFPKLRGAVTLARQLVGGIQAVRKAKGEAAWKADMAPKLAESLDEAAKKQVDAILATLPKA